MRLLLAGIFGALLLAPSSVGATTGSQPVLILSRSFGIAGTRVLVTARGCTKPAGQADTLAWHDHYYWLHDQEKKPPMNVWRSIPLTRTSATTVRAVFRVRRADHVGRGLLDLFCGVGGNATATFVVRR